MASVFKRTRIKPIPAGAEIAEYRGKRVAVWTNRKTKRRQRAPLTEDGKRIAVEDAHYTIEYFDHEGQRRRKSSRCPDKDAAQQLANSLETKVMQRREGLVDATQERIARENHRPILEHTADFKMCLLAKGDTEKHAELTDARIQFIIEDCGFGLFARPPITGANWLKIGSALIFPILQHSDLGYIFQDTAILHETIEVSGTSVDYDIALNGGVDGGSWSSAIPKVPEYGGKFSTHRRSW